MSGWQVDAMWEAESARIWEDVNAPDPFEKQMITAAGTLKSAIDLLDKATDWVAEAAYDLNGTPMENLVACYEEQMESILSELKSLQEKYGRGIRD